MFTLLSRLVYWISLAILTRPRSDQEKKIKELQKVIDDTEKKRASLLHEIKIAERRSAALRERSSYLRDRAVRLSDPSWGKRTDSYSAATEPAEYVGGNNLRSDPPASE
jgi:septal ring factor EnvC (AmiA/AmiB activator)